MAKPTKRVKKTTVKPPQDPKIYTSVFPVNLSVAVMGKNPDDARAAVLNMIGALQLVLKMDIQVLSQPVMEEYAGPNLADTPPSEEAVEVGDGKE